MTRNAGPAQPSLGAAVKGNFPADRGAELGDPGAVLGAQGAPVRAVRDDDAELGADDLADFGGTRAHGTRDGGTTGSKNTAALERLEARLQKLAQLRGTEAQVLRALAADLREALDVFARSSPDARVETTPATDTANAPPREQLLDVGALAALLAVTEKTVRRWRDEGRLPPAIEIGGVIRWRRSTVDAWLAEREEEAR